jgi:hypothetical protein
MPEEQEKYGSESLLEINVSSSSLAMVIRRRRHTAPKQTRPNGDRTDHRHGVMPRNVGQDVRDRSVASAGLGTKRQVVRSNSAKREALGRYERGLSTHTHAPGRSESLTQRTHGMMKG